MQMKTCDFGREGERGFAGLIARKERTRRGNETEEGLKKGKGDKVPRPVT